MEQERRSGADRRQHNRRKEDKKNTYDTLAYELDCKNKELENISGEINKMHRKG
jgi:hypothetical protein